MDLYLQVMLSPNRVHFTTIRFVHRKRLHEFDVTEEQLREADVRCISFICSIFGPSIFGPRLIVCINIFALQYKFWTPRAETLTAYISHNETLGSSPSGRGFRAKANYYATEDDLVTILKPLI